jgi:hypothetical protein
MSLFYELQEYLKTEYGSLSLTQPLFFKGIPALRFDLQQESFGSRDDDYFIEVDKRIKRIFNTVTNDQDKVILFYNYFTWKRRKIRKGNYLLKQMNKDTAVYKFKRRYSTTLGHNYSKGNASCQLVIKDRVKNINFYNIFTAIANNDFGIDPKISGELYIVNQTQKTVMLMYDDRGCDLLSNNVLLLKEFYKELSDLVLEVNRDEIEKYLSI